MTWVSKAMLSTIGSKVLMALTGLAMLGFLVGHLVGNLLIFVGQDALNAYAQGLHDMPAVIWAARFGLLGAIFVHILAAKRLTMLSMAATPTKYAVQKQVKSSVSSRTMFPTGLFLFVYLLYHLAHYTMKWTNPEFSRLASNDVYHMVIMGFQTWWVSAFYIVAVIMVGFHLNHGISSAFQTLGLNHGKYNRAIRSFGPIVSGLLALGFASIPLAVMIGVVK